MHKQHISQEIKYELLFSTIKKCYDYVPFYKNLFDLNKLDYNKIKSLNDINLIPFTNKTDLINNYPFGLFAVDQKEIVRIHQSSGTHDVPKVIGYTHKDLKNWQNTCIQTLKATGCTNNDVIQIAFNYGLFTGGLGFHAAAEKLRLTVIPSSCNNTYKQISLLKDMQTTILCCTPSYALYIGNTIKKLGEDPKTFNLNTAILGAENLSDNMRKLIETLFNLEVYNTYGLSEMYGPGVAFECEYHCGMHINEDYFLPEVINPKTLEVLENGEIGELVLTTLQHQAMPLLRYRTGDLTSLKKELCPCGRTLIKMSNPLGRSDDMFIIKGVNIFPSQIENVIFKEISNIADYRIIIDKIDNIDRLTVDIDLLNSVNDKNLKGRIEKILKNKLCVKANVNILVDNLAYEIKAKTNHLIDRRKISE
ncbi:MAG: phenylacetate--CoA ligase [Endomicrobium sp.]|jgi:phenylacetate-CoA ligase|nr:phenylacetate--CoA ligase [Endomicrobium sp.]